MKKELVIEKLKKEYQELDEKYGNLIDALNDGTATETIGETQRDLLEDQTAAMRLYLRTLEMRLYDLESEPREEVTKKKQEETQKKKQENKKENYIKEKQENTKEEGKKKVDYAMACMGDVLTYLEDYIKAIKKDIENQL